MIDVPERLRAIVSDATRMTAVPFGTRCAVLVAGIVSLVIAYPGWLLLSRPGMLLLFAPVLPALLPKGRSTTAVALLALAGWLVSTTVDETPVRLWRVLALAASLYLLHSLAALAAVLPYDALVPAELVTGWLGRAFAVILASAVLAVSVLAAAARTGDRAVLAAALVGLAVAVALTALLATLWRRR